MDMRYFIILVAFVLYKKKAKTVEDVFFVSDIDFVLITHKGGRFSDIGILLMSKKGVVQKYTTPPPPPPRPRVEPKTFFCDTRYLILQLGENNLSVLS